MKSNKSQAEVHWEMQVQMPPICNQFPINLSESEGVRKG